MVKNRAEKTLNKERKNFQNRKNIERKREVSGQDGRFGISGYRQW